MAFYNFPLLDAGYIPGAKESTEVRITQENRKRKMKKSPDKRHTQTHGSLIETFRQSQVSLSTRRE